MKLIRVDDGDRLVAMAKIDADDTPVEAAAAAAATAGVGVDVGEGADIAAPRRWPTTTDADGDVDQRRRVGRTPASTNGDGNGDA